jgi:HAD superfamily hydrolase (TIGR01509 family)
MLSAEKDLPRDKFDTVWREKQIATFSLIRRFGHNHTAKSIISQLKMKGWKVAVASNSIRDTVRIALEAIGILADVDYYVSNEDVSRCKPYPEMYWKCMTAMNALPKNTIIIEDSHIGRQGALDSGAELYAVENAASLNGEKFMQKVEQFEKAHKDKSIPWKDSKLNVVIPMAGAGSRFQAAGYTFPKPLIEVKGKPMIQLVVENLNIQANYIFLVQQEHYTTYNLKYLLNLIAPGCKIVIVDGLTRGSACTTLLAKEYIDNDNPILMANSDQYVEWNSNECMYAFKNDNIDGGILTFKATHPKWSFAKLDENGFVSEVAEKKVISDDATVGIYYWKHGSDYVKYAEQMIAKNITTNNEYYICPVFNEAIQDGKKIRVKQIDRMWGIGTPEDLNVFLSASEYK